MSLNGLRFTLNVDGQEPDSFAVVYFQLVQNFSQPFILNVSIASSAFDKEAKDLLEKKATLTIWQGPKVLRYVNGVISGFMMKENDEWQMQYHIRIQPPLWRCDLRKNFRIFQQQDIKAISATLLSENGVTDWATDFNFDHPTREFCVQYGESDLGFLSRLWAEEGIFFFEKPLSDGTSSKLALCDDVTRLSRTDKILPFNPNTTAGITTEYINELNYEANIRSSSIQSQDYTFKVPGWGGQYTQLAENLNNQFDQYEFFDYPGRFKDEQHGQDFTRYQMDGLRNDAEKASGFSNSAELWPGSRFQLTGHPQKSLNREWQVVSSTIVGNQPEALHSGKGRGTTMNNQFTVIPADRTWRPSPLPKPRVDGPQSAIVTGPEGEEIFCDEHGRVRVKFHWDRYHQKNEDSSCWIRVSQAWAGAGFGHLAIPRINQEVIVDFLNGDPDQPIIMGRTYHQNNRSPGDLPGTKTQMAIRSKTYQGSGYNELMFEDSTGNELLSMHAQKDMDTKVLHDRRTTVFHDHTENIGNDQKVRIKKDRNVLIGHNLRQVVLSNQRTTTLKNKKEFTGLTSRETVGLLKSVTVGGAYQTTVVGEMNTTVALAQTEEVGLLKSVTVGGPLTVSSTTSITFTCGASSITMDASGVITIIGTAFDFSAKGPVQINGMPVDIN
ncbi:type VI secretion system tip protein VgrG [Citrobacter sp. wls619]|uniref:type VI secretion system Vgr family protein n=1 Tax=Citrobacter sp. wls619 TaxID=2576432 RepID=UPI0010C93815|nr:type VI secretion system tip protein TssI/VgrG [Citrobacter sp. wls619]TKV11722.1 type VI secretion system tip protein VgrG [Citrobacter sp. wls619]